MKPMKRWQAGLAILMLSGATNWSAATIQLNNTASDCRVTTINFDSSNVFVDLLASIDGAIWQPVHVAGSEETVLKVDGNGYFDAGIGVIPNVPDNSQVNFQLRAWTQGANYETAVLRNYEVWTQNVGSWDPDTGMPATGPVLLIPHPMSLGMPEPGTLALVLLGGGLLAGHRRLFGR